MIRPWTEAFGLEKREQMRNVELVVFKYSVLFEMDPKFNRQINKNISPIVEFRHS